MAVIERVVVNEVLGHAGRVGADGRRLPHRATLEHAEGLGAPLVHRVTLAAATDNRNSQQVQYRQLNAISSHYT